MNTGRLAKMINSTNLILIRGQPGSGKTTLARLLVSIGAADCHFEADDYFGEPYKFEASKLREAHLTCQFRTKEALAMGRKVVVANTFIKKRDMIPYLAMTKNVAILVARGAFKNVHNVPDYTLERMKEQWEE
jgi:energy-coupling factor transporter ATP-binding protein EcfA2